ncbi:MAG: DUF2318 domain-containing protein [Synergistaceae bacterium]|jgi:uncharacterized membrane protein|nr:DUF2318 domain-containing protein [Synergistaceae bacterium]
MSKPENIKKRLLHTIVAAAIFGGQFFSGGLTGAAMANQDLVIKTDEITSTAKFYPVDVEGVSLEVIAVRAPDGSIRTAFNTCQVCYDSGRGYYIQDGNALVCQNCGNRYRLEQIETASRGCNPVPIFKDSKTVTDASITISYDFLKKAKIIFSNWKSE